MLRGIERDEVAAAVALINAGTLSPGAEDASRLDDYWAAVLEVRDRGGELLVALHGGVVVGMCQVIIFRHFQHTAGWCAELESVYVRSDARGQGVGAAMLAHAEAFAHERGRVGHDADDARTGFTGRGGTTRCPKDSRSP